MSDLHRRKRLRLQGYDYSQGGGYLLTIDVLHRRKLFGDVKDGQVILSRLGEVVTGEWTALPNRYPGLMLDEFVVMPDHFHSIVILSTVDVAIALPNLIDVIGYFKSVTTKLYHAFKTEQGLDHWPPQLWQRSYYERVLRGDRDLDEKRNYIRTNPLRYELKRLGLT